MTSAVRTHLADQPQAVDPRGYLAASRSAMIRAVAAFIGALNGAAETAPAR
ncbi:hypothetical protein SRB17_79230 [Streptomyces sp. RB17]|uniref:hypothetical protein n=1 Tax=Streptomyces sp. RB17 TaxID=2585197 RepID=UPI0012950A15|nr:hypothetical protein [Streptomyces sp. RB17]MQY39895.1 hypothetical protein [Streptomyces sp. RB17]